MIHKAIIYLEAGDMAETKSFGEWLRHRRRELDLTQEELARQIGCARITVRKIEADQMRPSKQLAELLMEQLRVAPDERENFMRFARGGESAKSIATTAPHDHLPNPISSFIGREREIGEVKRLIGLSRLVTLTGASGCGKSRLAYKVADEMMGEFEHGIWIVELAPLADPALVLQSIAATFGIHEKSGRTLNRLLAEHLQPRRTLLLVDNCEHLIHPCAVILEELLQACPDLKVLATSSEMLGISGEMVWTVPPLSMPDIQPWKNPASAQDALQAYQQSEAVRLFVARAASAESEFTMTIENGGRIAEICRRLDGMPLAIELAAARVRSLSVAQIAERLDDRFHLLTGGSRTGPLRQQTLTATLDWSYSLLSDQEQKVLQRLSVFASGATVEAAEAVCAGEGVESGGVLDVLSNLVNKSMVTPSRPEGGETRYHQLETIRQYARERLEESGEGDESKNRHLNYFVHWAEKAEPYLSGGEQVLWLKRYEIEHDNLRAALEWSLTSEGKVDLGLRLAESLEGFWHTRGYYSEGRAQLAAVLEKTKANARSDIHAKALYLAGGLAFVQTDYPATRALVEESLSIYRDLGASGRLGLANALIRLGDMWRQLGSYETAFSLLEEGLRYMRELNDLKGLVKALWQLGYYSISMKDYRQAEQYFTEALPLSRQKGDESDTTVILSGLGESALRQGNFGRAAAFEEESLMLRREIGEKWGIAVSLANFAWIALHQDDFGKAGTLLLESLAIRREIEDLGGMAWCLEKLAKINILYGQKKSRLQSMGNLRRATRLFGAAAALRAPVGSVIDQVDQPEYDRDLEVLRTALGKEAFSNLWIEGEAMPLEEVIDEVLAQSTQEPIRSEKEKFGGLTGRERQVARLISQGKSNREIAKAMTVGAKTVETYVTRILNKLGFNSRVQIATWMIEKGFEGMESQ